MTAATSNTIETVIEAIDAMRGLRAQLRAWQAYGDAPAFPAPVAEALDRVDRFFEEDNANAQQRTYGDRAL